MTSNTGMKEVRQQAPTSAEGCGNVPVGLKDQPGALCLHVGSRGEKSGTGVQAQ